MKRKIALLLVFVLALGCCGFTAYTANSPAWGKGSPIVTIADFDANNTAWSKAGASGNFDWTNPNNTKGDKSKILTMTRNSGTASGTPTLRFNIENPETSRAVAFDLDFKTNGAEGDDAGLLAKVVAHIKGDKDGEVYPGIVSIKPKLVDGIAIEGDTWYRLRITMDGDSGKGTADLYTLNNDGTFGTLVKAFANIDLKLTDDMKQNGWYVNRLQIESHTKAAGSAVSFENLIAYNAPVRPRRP